MTDHDPFPDFHPDAACFFCGVGCESPWHYVYLPRDATLVESCRAIEDWLANQRGTVVMECRGK